MQLEKLQYGFEMTEVIIKSGKIVENKSKQLYQSKFDKAANKILNNIISQIEVEMNFEDWSFIPASAWWKRINVSNTHFERGDDDISINHVDIRNKNDTFSTTFIHFYQDYTYDANDNCELLNRFQVNVHLETIEKQHRRYNPRLKKLILEKFKEGWIFKENLIINFSGQEK